jgi:hypothetical protein
MPFFSKNMNEIQMGEWKGLGKTSRIAGASMATSSTINTHG